MLESSEIPPHMTIAQWRRHRQAILRDQRAQVAAGPPLAALRRCAPSAEERQDACDRRSPGPDAVEVDPAARRSPRPSCRRRAPRRRPSPRASRPRAEARAARSPARAGSRDRREPVLLRLASPAAPAPSSTGATISPAPCALDIRNDHGASSRRLTRAFQRGCARGRRSGRGRSRQRVPPRPCAAPTGPRRPRGRPRARRDDRRLVPDRDRRQRAQHRPPAALLHAERDREQPTHRGVEPV